MSMVSLLLRLYRHYTDYACYADYVCLHNYTCTPSIHSYIKNIEHACAICIHACFRGKPVFSLDSSFSETYFAKAGSYQFEWPSIIVDLPEVFPPSNRSLIPCPQAYQFSILLRQSAFPQLSLGICGLKPRFLMNLKTIG